MEPLASSLEVNAERAESYLCRGDAFVYVRRETEAIDAYEHGLAIVDNERRFGALFGEHRLNALISLSTLLLQSGRFQEGLTAVHRGKLLCLAASGGANANIGRLIRLSNYQGALLIALSREDEARLELNTALELTEQHLK